MPTRSILIVNRMVLEEGERKYRVIFIDGRTRNTWLIDVDDDSWAFPKNSSDLQSEVDSGDLQVIPDPYGSQPLMDVNSASYQVMTRRYQLIKPFVQEIKNLLRKRDRALLIASIPTSRQTATVLLKLFLKRGMNKYALRPSFWKCGKPKDCTLARNTSGTVRREPRPDAKKFGRHRSVSTGVGINVDAMVRRRFIIGADNWFSSNGVSMQSSWDLVVNTYYSKKRLDPVTGDEVYEVEPDLKPTLRQFQYFIQTEYPEEYKRRKRHGTQYYELNEREILGWADGTTQGPGDEFQVDASVANVPLVSQFDRRRIVGYPVIYFIVDVFSRLITGVSTGFEGPSWAGAMMVLINMVTPKVEFCRKYGINITDDQWPSFHAPKHILADRAELMSVRLGNDIVENLNIGILNVTARRPDLKALVERRFGIIKTKFGAFAPGFVKDKFIHTPRVKDVRLSATLNLFEFTQLLIRAVLVHNLTPIRNHRPPPEMVTEGHPPTPLNLWNWGIENRSGILHQLSIEKTMINVMHRDTARVTPKGIKYQGIYYSSPSSIRDEWFARARQKEWDVEIGIEPANMGRILLLNTPRTDDFEVCTPIKSAVDYQFKSLYEIGELQFANKQNIAVNNNDLQSNRITHESAINEVIQQAVKEKRQLDRLDTRSKTEKTKHIREARAQEKVAQQKQNSIFASLGVSTDISAPPTEELPSPSAYKSDIDAKLKEEKERRKKG